MIQLSNCIESSNELHIIELNSVINPLPTMIKIHIFFENVLILHFNSVTEVSIYCILVQSCSCTS